MLLEEKGKDITAEIMRASIKINLTIFFSSVLRNFYLNCFYKYTTLAELQQVLYFMHTSKLCKKSWKINLAPISSLINGRIVNFALNSSDDFNTHDFKISMYVNRSKDFLLDLGTDSYIKSKCCVPEHIRATLNLSVFIYFYFFFWQLFIWYIAYS